VSAEPLLTIFIPCYNQPELLQQCLESILAQGFGNFRIVILDDASTVSYLRLLGEFPDPRIEYVRHPHNLGAMKNMLGALKIKPGSRYLMVFHEDDLMAPGLLNTSVSILEADPDLVFTGSRMLFFDDPEILPASWTAIPQFEVYSDQGSLLRQILGGAKVSFGSVVYRTAILGGMDPWVDYERYWTLCDRPFLCKLALQGKWALIEEDLVYSRRHGAGDHRSQGIQTFHFLNLLKFYRACLPQNWDRADQRLYYRWVSRALLNSQAEDHSQFFLVAQALRLGLTSPEQVVREFTSILSYRFKQQGKRAIKFFIGKKGQRLIKTFLGRQVE
jgi:glycosyltransferase involved in cell wall biosynthesis